jgi:hypothetical protein
MQYLRGFENIMLDMVAEEPLLEKLVEMIYAHNLNIGFWC